MSANKIKRILGSTEDTNDEPSKKKTPLDVDIDLVDDTELADDDVPVQANIDEYSVVEKNVGICEFVNPGVYGLFGIVKQRYRII